VKTEGNIEEWMQRVDIEMKKTLHVFTKKAVFHYAKKERIEWVREHIGMVTLLGT
jgi:dynein heavy chain